jgi:hypothetical protein
MRLGAGPFSESHYERLDKCRQWFTRAGIPWVAYDRILRDQRPETLVHLRRRSIYKKDAIHFAPVPPVARLVAHTTLNALSRARLASLFANPSTLRPVMFASDQGWYNSSYTDSSWASNGVYRENELPYDDPRVPIYTEEIDEYFLRAGDDAVEL